ncbi:MAG: gamma-glutamyl-gamma-aminobutyrate hydrolase family protein [Phycisphaerae bacterium]|nr:gamma-glutamyl-gamma-aminobutyrate hydrolase family protein [Phycisphaerae bacterium]
MMSPLESRTSSQVPARPLIGLTPSIDVLNGKTIVRVNAAYVDMLTEAGGAPVVLTPDVALVDDYVARLDGFVLTGGPDIDVRPFGLTLHPKAEIMDARRQAFDFALLQALDTTRERAALGICLGMQEMGVHGGCPLIQHMHDEVRDAERHSNDGAHLVTSAFGEGAVASSHHQALGNARHFDVIATSDDGVIEGIRDATRPFYVGVQWHPERTADRSLGLGVMRQLVEAARHR